MQSYVEETLQDVESPEGTQSPEEKPEHPDTEAPADETKTAVYDGSDIRVYADDGTKTDVEDYEFDYAGNRLMANLYTDASGEKVATITKVEAAGAEVLAFPDTILYSAKGTADKEYTVTKIRFSNSGIPYDNAFTSVQFPKGVKEISLGYGTRNLSEVKELTIPGSVKDFDGQLQNMEALETLTFAEGVKEISNGSVVSGCSNLTTIRLPSTLKKLSGSATFSNATELETITLPEGIEITQGSTFSGCTALKEIVLPASITKINSSMFAGCTSLQKVTAKGTITEIGNDAFGTSSDSWGTKTYKDENLVEIPDLSQVTTIGERAFNECAKLKTVDLHNVKSLGVNAFYNCKALSGEIDLSGVDEIPGYAFSYDQYITSVKTSPTLKSIGTWAFIWADIQSIDLPETLESIGTWAFYRSSLSGTVKLPDSLKTLGDSAFKKCTGIEDVEIGSNLTTIPSGVFDGCTSLKTITVDNSQDNVTATFPKGVTVQYTVPSIKDAGDTIAAGGKTLQQAVDEAEDGGTITIEKDIQLIDPVTIPAGKSVSITSENREIIIGDSSSEPENLFVIPEGASLRLTGSVELYGRYNTGSIVKNNGELTLDGANVLITGGTAVLNKGVLDNSGANAKLVLKSGTIEKNKVRGQRTASVRLSEGASFEMSGGFIQNNELVSDPSNSDSSSPAVLLYGLSDFNMTGGEIRENKGFRGGGVVLTGDDSGRAYFEMTGGSINHNVCSSESSAYSSAGAVYVCDNAMFLMGGGEIDSNSGGAGGGVCVQDSRNRDADAEDVTSFILDGGRITNNKAGVGGGGVYSLSNGVRLLSGLISGNEAMDGGGVYSEGSAVYFSPARYTTLYMENVVIRNNTAEQGGGAWFCPTGDAKFYLTNGAAIYENTATGAGDDFASAPASRDRNNSTTIPSRMLGGGKVIWYKDGAINDATHGANHTSVVPGVERYQPGSGVPLGPIEAVESGVCVKASASQEAISNAEACAQLIIENNTATYGGGIGANGSIVIGDGNYPTYQLTVSKVWDNKGYPEAQPDQVTVFLKEKYTGDLVDTAELSEANDWQYTFADLPMAPSYYTVEEEPLEDYDATYQQDENGDFTITNTFRMKSVSVSKIWVDAVPEFRPASIEVELTAVDRAGGIRVEPRTATLSEENGWSYVFTDLPACRTYLVTEKTQVAGYQTTITGDDETGFVITNTAQPTPVVPPEDPPVSFRVEKKWVNDSEADRPAEIYVNLWNGVTRVSRVKLTAENDWQYTFTLLPAGSYSVTEDPVEGYTTGYDRDEDGNFIITNTGTKQPDTPVPPPDTPDTPVKPAKPDEPWYDPGIPVVPLDPEQPSEEPEKPSSPVENPPAEPPVTEITGDPETTPPTPEPKVPTPTPPMAGKPETLTAAAHGRKLIQTGQNWWTVWALAAAGGSLILLGIRKHTKKKDEA